MQPPGVRPRDAAAAPESTRGIRQQQQAELKTQAAASHDAVALTGASLGPVADDGHLAAAIHPGAGMELALDGGDRAPSPMQRDALGGNDRLEEGMSTAERTTEGTAAEEGTNAVQRQASEGHGAGPLGAASTPTEGSGAYLQDLDQESLPPKKKRHKGFTIKLGGRTL